MTITHKWQGHSTPNAARIVIRSDANGVATVECNGATFFGTSIDTAVDDGIGVVDVLGLESGRSYPYTVTVAGESSPGVLRTMPQSAPVKLGFLSCIGKFRPIDALVQSLIDEEVSAVVHQGDYVYVGESLGGWWGETTSAPVTGSAASVYMAHYRQVHNMPCCRMLDAFCAQYWQGDDHEVGGDNWDHTVTQAQLSPNVASGGTQAQVDASWWVGNQAMLAYYRGNPANDDAGIQASVDKPANAAVGTSSAQYPPKYFRFSIGNAEVFVLDCISYRSPVAAADNSAKTMLGATQKQWLKDRLSASAAKWKIISSQKMTYAQNSTGDGWGVYGTELAELLAYIRDNVPSKGVFWACGDNHAPTASVNTSLEHSSACLNPAGVDHISQNSGYAANVVYKFTGQAGGVPARSTPVAGLIECRDDMLVVRIVDPLGRTLWRDQIPEGSNLFSRSAGGASVG